VLFWNREAATNDVAVVANEMELLNVDEGRSQGNDLGPVKTHLDEDDFAELVMNH